ncbi:MAG: hypothetical protein R2736_20350 [Solirubrobacterales bacterium]
MTKTQAEPGPAATTVVNPDGSVTVGAIDTALQVPPRLRWVGSGRTVLNNKANPVRKMSRTLVSPAYESLPALVATGVSATLTYDPAGRLVRTDMPDGTFLTAEFDPWRGQPRRRRHGGAVALARRPRAPAHRRAADRRGSRLRPRGGGRRRGCRDLRRHAGHGPDGRRRPPDPALDHLGFDAAGHGRAGADEHRPRRRGQRPGGHRRARQPPHRLRLRPAGRCSTQASMDAGRRWSLPTVSSRVYVRWDERGTWCA